MPTWITEYKWHDISGLNSHFLHAKVQACSEGLILPQWFHGSEEEGLEYFLLIRRDGNIELGLGRDVYYTYEDVTIFRFIPIVGRLWQFLVFIKEMYRKFFPNFPENTRIIVNIRGTKGALLGNLAEGWKQPIPGIFDSYRPICPDKHLQIQKNLF